MTEMAAALMSTAEISASLAAIPSAVGTLSSETTLHPTTHTVDVSGGGSVVAPANSYDLSSVSFAKIVCALGQSASVTVSGHPDDAAPGARTAVTVRALIAFATADPDDLARVYFAASPAASFSLVAQYAPADVGATPVWVDVDVTALAGSNPSSGFLCAVGFSSHVADPPPPGE